MIDYTPLENYLAGCGKDTITLTFDEIGKILGDDLPPSAQKYPAWWSNIKNSPTTHTHAYSWYNAGYKASPKLKERKTVFTKLTTAPTAVPQKSKPDKTPHSPTPIQSAKTPYVGKPDQGETKARKFSFRAFLSSSADKRTKVPNVGKSEDRQMKVCGYTFHFVQQLIPDCENGKVIKYYPQSAYNNHNNLPLSKHGKGAFCRFTINAPASAGVYLWIVNGTIIYIGETQNLEQRFNMGYGYIAPRNCYIGGQSTNCKMNKVVMEFYERGTPIDLYFYETDQYKQVELELLRRYNTKYNVKDN